MPPQKPLVPFWLKGYCNLPGNNENLYTEVAQCSTKKLMPNASNTVPVKIIPLLRIQCHSNVFGAKSSSFNFFCLCNFVLIYYLFRNCRVYN